MCSFSTGAYAVYAAAGLRNLTGQTALPSEWILFLVRAAAFLGRVSRLQAYKVAVKGIKQKGFAIFKLLKNEKIS